MTSKTATRSPLILIPQHFGTLVFQHEGHGYYPFDHAGAAILNALRTQPIYDVMEDAILREATGGSSPLHAFLRSIEEAGWLDVNGRLPADSLEIAPPANHLAGPLVVHLEVIGACDLSCSHCFAGELPRNDHLLQLDELAALFADLASIGCFRLGITGGEPLLRRDLFEVLEEALRHGLHPRLTTNGTQLHRAASWLADHPEVQLNVSLDGATAASNDAVRGAGSFDRVVQQLRPLRGDVPFSIAFTLTRHSVGEVEQCVELASSLGAAAVVFRPLYPVGMAKEDLDLMPSFAEYSAALRRLQSLTSPDASLQTTQAGARQCGAGRWLASVSAQGKVSPCSFLGEDYDFESIREQPFSALWRSSEGLRKTRGLSSAPCGECSGGTDSGYAGGCRARSLVLAGGIGSADPWHGAFESGEGVHPLVTIGVRRERN